MPRRVAAHHAHQLAAGRGRRTAGHPAVEHGHAEASAAPMATRHGAGDGADHHDGAATASAADSTPSGPDSTAWTCSSLTTATTTTSEWSARSAGEVGHRGRPGTARWPRAGRRRRPGEAGLAQRAGQTPADVAEADDAGRWHRARRLDVRRTGAGRRAPPDLVRRCGHAMRHSVEPSRRGDAWTRTSVQTIVWTYDRPQRRGTTRLRPATSIQASATRTSPGRPWSGWSASTPRPSTSSTARCARPSACPTAWRRWSAWPSRSGAGPARSTASGCARSWGSRATTSRPSSRSSSSTPASPTTTSTSATRWSTRSTASSSWPTAAP